MPKLNAKQQQTVEAAETSDFGPLAEGIYTVKLSKVEVRPGNEAPYWSTEWEVVSFYDGSTDRAGRKLWTNLSTSEKAAWKMREFFDAMGYTYDSDTDEMVGDVCQAVVSQITIEQGTRKGQIGNQIERLLPADEDATVPNESDFAG